MKALAFCATTIVVLAMMITGCDFIDSFTSSSKVTVETEDSFKPDLPPVPKIPAPTSPEVYDDGSYSIFGLRKKMGSTIEQQISITAYIAKMYEKPECAKGHTCRTLMPHLFLADEKDEQLERRLVRLVGYGQSFKEIEEERKFAARNKGKKQEDDPYAPKVVWDWQAGHKYKIKAKFTRRSKEGFMATDGLLEYRDHECLDCETDEETK